MKTSLSNVTLIGIDCVDLKRLQLAADISTKDILFGSVKLLSSISSDDPRVVNISPIKSTKAYSDFVIKDLYKYVDTELALVFQYDGFILNPSAWSDEFLRYDYIGSPWYHLGDLHVGNGGFSLRSKRLMGWLAKNYKKIRAAIHPEDIFVSKFARPFLEQMGMKFAPEEVAQRFGKEGNERSVIWNGEFGFHGINYTDISNWLNVHPEYRADLTYKLDDYCTLMKTHPVYDGTVHTLRFGKSEMKDYEKLSTGNKDYEIRSTLGKYEDYRIIKEGHTIVFKRSGVAFKDVPIPAFEKKVNRIEEFDSLFELRKKYPKLEVTYIKKNLPKWKRPLVKILGAYLYPKNVSYTVFWFK